MKSVIDFTVIMEATDFEITEFYPNYGNSDKIKQLLKNVIIHTYSSRVSQTHILTDSTIVVGVVIIRVLSII
jgi:pyruvate-formate lyase